MSFGANCVVRMTLNQERASRESEPPMRGDARARRVEAIIPGRGTPSPRVALRQTRPNRRREDLPTLALSVFWLGVIVLAFLCGCGVLLISTVQMLPRGAAAPPPAPKTEPELTATPEPSPTRVVTAVPVEAKVIEDRVNLRAGPSTNAEILGKLERDDQITLLGRSVDGKWYQANITAQNEKGWVFAETLEIVSGNSQGLPVINIASP